METDDLIERMKLLILTYRGMIAAKDRRIADLEAELDKVIDAQG